MDIYAKSELILIDASESSNPTRTSKNANSPASGVSTAKRDIRKKADELIHMIKNQYDGCKELSPLTLVSEVLTRS